MKTPRQPLFWAIVGIPNLICLAYFLLLASPVYVSTASLIVYKPQQSSQSLATMLSGTGGGNSIEGAYIVKDYIGSWDEYRNVAKSVDLPKHYGQGDFVSRYGGLATLFRKNDVALWHYYQNRVNAAIDQNSGIVSLSVQGYSPTAAAAVAERVLQDSVRHIDNMNRQQESDYMKNAVDRRAAIEAKLKSDEAALSAYRVSTGIHDPSELYTSNLALLNSLNEQKTRLASQYDAIVKATPNNPVAQNLRAAMTAIQAKIASTEAEGKTLSRRAARYEELTVARNNDVALLREIETAVQQAQLNAMKNKYYLNIISAPSSPRAPELPRRLEWIAGVFLATLVLWGLLR
ncbi:MULTISPECIES: chain length determinant family protein [Burkholderia]|uniref:chain length determinant family protein n=1 Tax=Burkholderia TaxID=32008 RepID=UPI0003280E03|nr:MULTISPECIES: chain length determinant family protein [Burkholderia]AGK51524.1 chain length determinant family protein [Burkholderia thailandensis MSMB121]ATF32655.1 lipopolysaccharide biosynthesis protein [Burkholderia thailandensis]KST71163.1 lipopolysaccharide biosynthesis protein [Burkholderia humptydooensis]KVN05826.1 lipopolysaccharide biosynthesis protein [Burkholderia sp. MSMB1552]KWZ50841.1 lipopolysaccharide biosynthesis protein [Burkholderia sp. MSMB1588]